MAISCAYCGGAHDAPADVKACWAGQSADAVTTSSATTSTTTSDRVATPDRVARRDRPVVRGVAEARPGPDLLGRHLVVSPGADAPPPWHACARIVIDDATLERPDDVLAELRNAHHTARRLVIEMATDLAEDLRETSAAAPYAHGARFTFAGEELSHLVWSNSLDARNGTSLRWGALGLAVSLGAGAVENGPGDVVLADGSRAWLDAGPVRFHEPIDGVAVVHVVAVEHGSWTPPVSNSTGAELAPDQLAAVTHAGGGARIIAPAGSGKTRVLTERARHLLTQWQLPPSAVSLVAFNKRAQEEMQERTTDLAGLHVRTLNSIALAIVNGTPPFAPQPRRWRTIDEPDVRRLIGDLVRFPKRRNSDPVAPWIEALSSVRLGLITPEDVEAADDGEIEGFAAFWPRYRSALERGGVVDFDDQIYRALGILLGDADARRVAQRACRVMLVDEFQDLTPAHLLLVRLLAAPGGAVFGVGDDDQTIYGYNGADPAWLIDFADLFPGAGDHPLEVNYRCPGGLVDVVDRLLRHNRRRVPKTIRAASDDPGGWRVDERVDAVSATVEAVLSSREGGTGSADIAVLARVNAVLAPVQVALSVAGVPVRGGVGLEFVDRTAVRSVLAWIRLATARRDALREEDLREALRRPSRSFHPRITDWVAEQRSLVDLHRLSARLNKERDSERVTEFATDIQTLRERAESGATTSDLVLALVDEIGLASSVASLDSTRRGMNRASQGDDLTAIAQLAALHDDPSTFERWLRGHLAAARSADGVLLSTVHRVKGQEWPVVVVHLADRTQYPHRLAEDVEEERRLFHVALTRASRQAVIVAGPTPSPFVAELTSEPDAARDVQPVRPHAPDASSGRRRPSAGASSAASGSLDADGQRRYAALRELRNELRDGKPAYVVFDNRTLEQIARQAPATLGELARIPGIGPAKLERYGPAVIEMLQQVTGA